MDINSSVQGTERGEHLKVAGWVVVDYNIYYKLSRT